MSMWKDLAIRMFSLAKKNEILKCAAVNCWNALGYLHMMEGHNTLKTILKSYTELDTRSQHH